MGKKGILIALLLTFFGGCSIYAQFDPSIQVQLPASEAQSFEQLSEIPVDLYTGRVNISIPIYTVKNQDISMPITLSYHGGGIKVSDECGIVGLGWTLNTGGVVNRIVRGLPDDLRDTNLVFGYDYIDSTLYNNLSGCNDFLNLMKRRTDLERHPNIVYDDVATGNLSDYDCNLLSQISLYGSTYEAGHFDSSPDNYMFCVANLSGAFVLPKNRIERIIPQTDNACTIEKYQSNNFLIKDINGNQYYFEDQERQDYVYKIDYNLREEGWDSYPERKHTYTSSWWLSRICSANDNRIVYRYRTICHSTPIPSLWGFVEEERSMIYPFNKFEKCFNNGMKTRDTIQTKLLDSIISPLNTIVFDYESLPSHANRLPQLRHIRIFSIANDTIPQEQYDFEYSGTDFRSKLLKLTRVGSHGEAQHYAFVYDSISEFPAIRENDRRKDVWGYFSPDSKGTFPNLEKYLFPAAYRIQVRETGPRYANNTTATNNMLTGIQYPNGGKVCLVWEPHDFSEFSDVGRSADTDFNYRHTDSIITYQLADTFSLCGKAHMERLTVSRQLHAGDRLTIDMTEYYFKNDNYFSEDYTTCIADWICDAFQFNTRPNLIITRNGQPWRTYDLCSYAKPSLQPIHIITDSAGIYQFTLSNPRSIFLSNTAPCEMYYEIFNMGPPDMSSYGFIHCAIERNPIISVHPSQSRSVGGVRIKQIQYVGEEKPLLTKQYQYIQEDNSSSGVLAYPARFSSYAYNEYVYWPLNDQHITFILAQLTLRSNALPFVLNSDGHITYGRVIESTIDNYTYNQTIYTFKTATDIDSSDRILTDRHTLSYAPADMLQLTSAKFCRGHLMEKKELSDEVKTTSYYYDILAAQDVDTLTGSLFTMADFSGASMVLPNNIFMYKNMGIVMYQVIPYNKRVTAVQTVGTITNHREEYTYANNTYSSSISANLPLTHTTYTSEGDTIQEKFDYLPGSDKITGCITSKNGKVISAYRNVYDSKQRLIEHYIAPLTLSNLPSSENVTAFTLATLKTEEYTYVNNRLAQKKDLQTGVTTAYLWSYRNSYPVAIMENATIQAVQNILGASAIQQMSMATQPDITLLQSLRTLFPYSHVETMTYEPATGISSYTDANGFTMYYLYDGFGQLSEQYYIENGQKKIMNHWDTHWSY